MGAAAFFSAVLLGPELGERDPKEDKSERSRSVGAEKWDDAGLGGL